MRHLLDACRAALGPPPRKMDAAQAHRFRLRMRAMFEWYQRKIDDPMIRILEDQNILRDHGQIGWGYLIQANEALFTPLNVHTCPAHVLFSLDPYYDDRPDQLRELSVRLGASKHPGLVDILHILNEDGFARLLSREVPRELCGGRSVYFSSMYIEPRQLPGRYIAQPFFPALAAPDKTPAMMMLPSRYWPEELIEQWDPRPARTPPKRPKVVPADPDDQQDIGVPDDLNKPPPSYGFLQRLFFQPDPRPRAAAPWLRLIAHNPDNEELLTAFLKWLEACGDPQAELIRVQLEAEECATGHPRQLELDHRAGRIIDANRARWLGPLKALGVEPYIGLTYMPWICFHRGLLDSVTINRPDILPDKASRVFAAAPALQRIAIECPGVTPNGDPIEWQANLGRMFWTPEMRQIHELDLGMAFREEDTIVIAEIPYLENVHKLRLGSTEYGLEGAWALANTRYLTSLRDLTMNWGIGAEGIAALAASRVLGNLTALNLSSNYLGADGAKALFAAAHLGPIAKLQLVGNDITDAGVRSMVGCAALTGLTELNLDSNKLTARGCADLAAWPALARLEQLELGCNALGADGVRLLAKSPHLGRLKVLRLTFNEVTDAGMEALAASATIQRLRELHASTNKLGDRAALAIAKAPAFSRLRKLDLSLNDIGPDGAKALADSPHLANLDDLQIGNNPIELSGAKALARSKSLANLKRLHINEKDVGPKGMDLLRNRFGDAIWEHDMDPPDTGGPTLAQLLFGAPRE